MRPLLVTIGLSLVVFVALLFVRPHHAQEQRGTGVKVGVVFDIGGRGDKSFNDGAWEGAERAAKELGAEVRFIEPGDGADRASGLRILASEGMQLVVGVGFIFTDDLTELAREYPNVKFAGVDYALKVDAHGHVAPPPPNVVAIKFREQEGSFLVGALAALVGGLKKLGFVGGMDVPLIHKFEAGYRAGAKAVCANCTVVAQYAGVTPDAFRNPGRGKELALSQYQSGVNVIFHASGSTGLGVFEAARAMDKLVIGVDSDQSSEAPGHVLTSMVKRVDVAVFDVIKSLSEGRIQGGVRSFGLKEGGVDYVFDETNERLIPPKTREEVEALRREIVAGKLEVPDR